MQILITGASSGIGAVTAIEMAEGNTIYINYNSSHEKAKKVRASVKKAGGICHLVKADISTEEGCKSCIDQVKKHTDTLDSLVNCAGAMVNRTKVGEYTWQDFQDVYSLNVFGTLMITSLAVDLLKKGKNASVVNFTSGVILSGSPGAQLYASAKGAVHVFTKSISRTLAPDIRVNSVCPGVIKTAFYSDGEMTPQHMLDNFAESNPMKKNATKESVAKAVRFCIENEFLNGASIEIDGGKKGV